MRALLAHARNRRGGALFLTGEPGIGKTTLLEATTSDPTGMRLLKSDGFEAESTIPFAGVQRLTIPLREYMSALPERHQQALRVAAGVTDGPPPDRFLVGLGVLGLLAAAGEDEPVICVVDDAHLLDAESLDVLGFVARRLEAESVALVIAGRDTPRLDSQVAGVPALHLAGLEQEWAMRLLTASLPEADRPGGRRADRRCHRWQPPGPGRPGRGAERQTADRVQPGRRAAPGRSPPGGVLPAPDPSPHSRPAGVAADRGRGLHREHRPDPGGRPGLGPAGRPGRRGGVGRAGRARPRDPVPAPPGPVGGLQRGPGSPAPARHRALVDGRRPARTGRARGVARRQGHPRHRPGRGRPARAGRRPGRAARRPLVTGAAARPGLDADPAGSR